MSGRSRTETPTSTPTAASAATPSPGGLLNRRRLLTAAGVAGATTGLGFVLGPAGGSATAGPPAAARAVPGPRRMPAAAAAVRPSGAATTLNGVATATYGNGYRRLDDGPGWRRVLRTELAEPSRGREEKRTALASFVQFTDLHMVDVQHPLRYEYLRAETPSAWRPQEALSVPGVVSLIERVNALPGGPATGAPLSFVMTTGDNTDNNCTAELDWFLTAMSGGRITPNTGDPGTYEGVQNCGLELYWQPESKLRDGDKQLGFPRLDGFLEAAVREVRSPGLTLPWYSTVGNHDLLPGGCYAAGDGFLTEFAVGGKKLFDLPRAEGAAMWKQVRKGMDPKGEQYKDLLRTHRRKLRSVAPDPARAPFTPREYLAAHLDPKYAGAGPVGHGYTEANIAEDRAYYTFRIAAGVVGVSLDTTRRGGHYEGRLGTAQLRWLERELKRYRDDYVLVFSHHTSESIPEGGAELLALLKRNPHALAWINGHSHRNTVTPHGTFWEISTASHIDFPQLARTLELTDNGDGTLSLFTTLIESAAPHRGDYADLSQTGLASLYRELSFNAPGRRTELAGEAADRNTELVLRKPKRKP
ncbi:TIGR03767 family metallophosphoesterase [Streptomyces armeniacus]|uniref:TIGR03767 family metallophosphoesterase n=1 Tax=Streptomyces armeniacus TaxID=83291 RepID=A0A345XU24_9ACTN|nr:TIGR03767 family metallophosphoesterase [Streptomyces armeniacus]AXK35140.1 TIGR03767 family metallophosphoesterase [Streptomyces armeniacus]